MEQPVIFEKISFEQEKFFQAYLRLTAKEEHHVLLESGRTGRYSIAGIKPFAVVHGDEQKVEIRQGGETHLLEGKPLQTLEKWMQQFSFPPQPGLPDFQGGAIGFISYDYAWCIEKLPYKAADDVGLPLLYFLVFDEWAVFDHEEQSLWLMTLNRHMAKEKLTALKADWIEGAETPTKSSSNFQVSAEKPQLSFTEEEFAAAVEKIKDYIREGDVSQVNLTVRQSETLAAPPINVYKELRKLNPSPYMGYFHTPEFQIVSGSPELLIKKDGRKVATRPIGGTRSRGKDEAEDKRLEQELLSNEKEKAEHIMLVDLERNDMGKVCEFGSVNVDELMVIEKYSHVMHIVSHVSGTLSEGKTSADLIEAVFPGGSITGAPKIRTLEIIEELEPVKRGVYTGTMGWIGFNEDLHLNIVIRTMIVKDEMCHVQAGAGIVIDSNPKAEYKESLKKAAALWNAKNEADKKGAFA
ncbi:anthranilate synthase component I family protein [Siminovitchia acidinfaciens]|uniref:Anthranilate synthase component I family protein n=1 Tax=Siminovitchia acidinfaciens TaxID=2321395 RepID=A0A429XVI2_9BACI|nr:anthranilate synthase component I family protein [Siminovitchia acidinfaciens]RST72278.1 anthranilate synthase component I family protein [Siminovitchia acidinfaciens]